MLQRGAIVIALLLFPSIGRADWQIKPFAGVTFGGDTTFIDLDQVAGSRKLVVGVSGAWFGEVLGVEADVGRVPGYFSGGHLVAKSSVTTTTASAVIALPRRLTKYTLRPYFLVGGGIMHVRVSDFLLALPVASNMGTIDLGAGATGFFNERIGVSWDVRYFRSVGGTDQRVGLSIGPERLSLWRVTTALTIRP